MADNDIDLYADDIDQDFAQVSVVFFAILIKVKRITNLIAMSACYLTCYRYVNNYHVGAGVC